MQIRIIHKADNVGIVLDHAGEIPFGHKAALREIRSGEPIIKYGVSIGAAVCDIHQGDWVHTHNMRTSLGEIKNLEYHPMESAPSEFFDAQDRKLPVFSGYRREDGQTGIRNDLWIIPTVGCVNSFAQRIKALAEKKMADQPGVFDNVLCLTHSFGCSRLEEDTERLTVLLRSLCRHPNAAGVLLIGLGCEHTTVASVLEGLGDAPRVRGMVCQQVEDEEAKAMELIDALMRQAANDIREDIPVSELILGVKCGGSDSLSGVTANPLAGRVMDRVITFGGSGIMGEIPEMFGAEHVVLDRCASQGVFDEASAMIDSAKAYYLDRGAPISENPSPGNKEGGITTLEEKSMGCVQKGGTTPLRGAVRYGYRIQTRGLNMVESPGNDLVSTTAIAAAGAHLILFTTGRGTPMGGIVPTIKISSNADLSERKRGAWIDFDAGRCLAEGQDQACEQELWELIIDVASGKKKTRSETKGCQEFAVLQTGVIL
ncbi:MAG: altronate dehydratase family protein [Bacillota bacterium]|nr:altronate dehydratase family protein [Bacillota bacterium]